MLALLEDKHAEYSSLFSNLFKTLPMTRPGFAGKRYFIP